MFSISLDNRAVKSAEPVTYDDNGNVIPLSERFNQEPGDIRYSREVNAAYNDEQKTVGSPLRTMAYTGKSGGNIA